MEAGAGGGWSREGVKGVQRARSQRLRLRAALMMSNEDATKQSTTPPSSLLASIIETMMTQPIQHLCVCVCILL